MQYDEYIATVDIRTEFVDSKTNHQRVVYKFTPYVFTGLDEIQIKGANLMPQSAIEGIVKACMPAHPYRVDIGVMDKVRAKIEKWYQDRGLPFCYVGYFDGMEEGMLRANVIEAKINDVAVRYEKANPGENDTEYDYYSEGKIVPADRIIEASGFKRGEHYHIDDGYDAMNNIYACGLLEDINIEPEQDMTDPSKINIRIKVDEIEPKSMEMDLDWTFQMKGGLPNINRQSLIPGGSVEISHENLFGDSQSLTVSLSSSDWRNPAQDLGFQFSYTEPFYAPNTTRNLQLFNTRKMSPIFTSPTEGEVPPVFVDRLGLKGWTSHCGGNDNKVEHSLMLQRINTSDENGQTVTKGTKVARGYYSDNGPPTTISSSGTDLSLSYQHFSALDDVQFVNGNQLGRRLLCQVDQGLNVKVPLPNGNSFGLSGGLYNRLMVTFTKFIQLPGLPKLTEDNVWMDRKAPNTLVLHARGGNCLGDMASYDYFSLGGPYSVRGYSYGELGACRRFLETAAEVRFPLKNHGLPGTAYAFVEYGTDLGSSKSLEGNPTEYYRKAGSGMSLGAGLKLLGCCRFECARDMNAGRNSLLVNWGERF
jgi:outer membrane protein assembly factor BamA